MKERGSNSWLSFFLCCVVFFHSSRIFFTVTSLASSFKVFHCLYLLLCWWYPWIVFCIPLKEWLLVVTLKVLTYNIFMSPDKSSKTWESQQGSYSDLAKVLNFLTLPWDLFICPLVLSPTIRIMAVSTPSTMKCTEVFTH